MINPQKKDHNFMIYTYIYAYTKIKIETYSKITKGGHKERRESMEK